tara:strand:- start:1521 stop:1769 length:249 start_codon:yes stop_codon:yes gene_type:complete
MRQFQVVHIKHDVVTIQAKSTYEAAKIYADMYELKSTAGIDVHLIPEVDDDVFGFAKAINTDVLDKMSTEDLKKLEEILEEV